jgi:small subunit ribosomal protein S20
MPNKKAAMKDLRKSKKRYALNLKTKSQIKHLWNTSNALLKAGKKDEAKEAVKAYQQAIDKAAKKGVVMKNKANRKKSTLMKALAR